MNTQLRHFFCLFFTNDPFLSRGQKQQKQKGIEETTYIFTSLKATTVLMHKHQSHRKPVKKYQQFSFERLSFARNGKLNMECN